MPKRRTRVRTRYHQREAAKLREAEARALVAKAQATRPGTTRLQLKAISEQTGISRVKVKLLMDQALDRLREIGPEFRGSPRNPEDLPPRPGNTTRRPGPGPHVHTTDEPPIRVFDGEIIDPPDEIAFRKLAFDLRKRALPFSQVAEITGRTEEQCRRAVKHVLRSLEQDELADTALAKRMMLEQIDSMIAAITVPATGRDIDGHAHDVAYEAIDRMLKLLDQKAKLLGLHAPQRVDLNHRIEVLAQETGYDIEELRDIAADVLKRYQTRSLT